MPETAHAPSMRTDVGTLVHSVLEQFHATPADQRDGPLLESLYTQAVENHDKEVQEKSLDILTKYWKTFGRDAAWQPTSFEAELRAPLTETYDLLGRLDELFLDHDTRAVKVGEVKTTLSKPDLLVTPFLNIQAQCYRFLVEQNYPGYRLDEVVYTLLWRQGAKRVVRPVTDTGPYWDGYLRRIAYEMEQLPVYMAPGYWCRGCPFNDTCLEAVMTGMDVLEMLSPAEEWSTEKEDDV